MLETENLRNVCVSDLPLPLPVSLVYFFTSVNCSQLWATREISEILSQLSNKTTLV